MIVDIITPDKQIFSGNATLIQLPGKDGLFEILENHAPLVAALKNGKVKIVSKDETLFFDIKGGIVEVMKNKVQLLAE
ncbi:MAG: ATP synthase F1 subunit epsilon [Bacteroidales bacterium]|jgi:F-type H+-transporting ATPase subunit epsilon|nr:ATP synthase F1 subunit epsilon [Bacteroidales bacterium]